MVKIVLCAELAPTSPQESSEVMASDIERLDLNDGSYLWWIVQAKMWSPQLKHDEAWAR